MTKARSSADYAAGGPSVAAKNFVINGGMDVWQRGTSFTGSTTAFCADRFQAYRNTTGSTFSRQATSDTTNLPFIQYCIRAQRNNGDTATNGIWVSQTLESVNSIPLAGKTVTLSFYARAGANFSSASNALTVVLASGTGTDQNIFSGFTGNANVVNTTATLTTTWQRFTFTGTVAATATQLATYTVYTPSGTAGAADYFEITGVQLEVGSVATPFSRAGGNIQGELAACQRYYTRFTADSSNSYFGGGPAYSSTVAPTMMQLPVQMRVAPTSVDYSTLALNDGPNTITVTNVTLNARSGRNVAGFDMTVASGLTTSRYYAFFANSSSSAYIGVSAEL